MRRDPLKSNLHYVATIIISYLLSLFLIILISCMILLQTIFSPQYMINQVTRSGFVQTAFSEVQEIYISHGSASGITPEVMLSTLKPEHIEDAIRAEIKSAYKTGDHYNYSKYENEIFDILHNFAVEEGFDEDEQLDEAIRTLAILCVSDFKTHIISPVIGMVGSAAVQYDRYVSVTFFTALVITMAFIALIPLLNRRISKWVSGFIYALGATAIMCAAVPVYVFSTGFTQRINITPQSYNDFLRSWIEGIARGYVIALIPILILLAVFITIWLIRRNKRNFEIRNSNIRENSIGTRYNNN